MPLWEESCILFFFWETDRNYYKGSRIGTQILKFLGSCIPFWRCFGRYTTGSTWTHGSHMERKSTVGNIATWGDRWSKMACTGTVYFTIRLSHDLFIHGRLRLVKFARYSVVPPKTPQASKLPITLFPVDWSVCMLCAYWYSQNLNFLPFSIFKLEQSIDQMTEKLKRLAAQDIFTVDRLVCSFLSDASISKRE